MGALLEWLYEGVAIEYGVQWMLSVKEDVVWGGAPYEEDWCVLWIVDMTCSTGIVRVYGGWRGRRVVQRLGFEEGVPRKEVAEGFTNATGMIG